MAIALSLPLLQRVQDVPLPFPAATSTSQNIEITDLLRNSKLLYQAPRSFPEAADFSGAG